MLFFLVFLLPSGMAFGEPPRVSVAVFNSQWEQSSGAWFLTICPRWINATVGDGYAFTIDGFDYPVNFTPIPYRPGWSWMSEDLSGDNCSDWPISGLDGTMTFAISATSGGAPPLTVGTVLSTSCNVTISPVDSFAERGEVYMCGSPGFTPEIGLSGIGSVSGNDTVFRLNHSVPARNATSYQYQYTVAALPIDSWFNLEPSSSGTIRGGNLSSPPAEDAYRLANFTFVNTSAEAGSRILWRVRAFDSFTYEMSPFSCEVALTASTDSFSRACYVRRFGGSDTVGASWPMVNLTQMGSGLGVSAQAAGGILLAGLAGLMVGVGMIATRSRGVGVFAAALAVGGGWIYNITGGWVLVISVYVASLVIFARIIPGGDK